MLPFFSDTLYVVIPIHSGYSQSFNISHQSVYEDCPSLSVRLHWTLNWIINK